MRSLIEFVRRTAIRSTCSPCFRGDPGSQGECGFLGDILRARLSCRGDVEASGVAPRVSFATTFRRPQAGQQAQPENPQGPDSKASSVASAADGCEAYRAELLLQVCVCGRIHMYTPIVTYMHDNVQVCMSACGHA